MSDDTHIPRSTDGSSADAQSVVIERELPHPPEKVWRALTEPHLIAEWLAKTEFAAVKGHRFAVEIEPQPGRWFTFDCEVTEVVPNRILVYSWDTPGDGSDNGLSSTVTWKLTATTMGTLLRMEQSGFGPDQSLYFHGARMGWPQFIAKFEALLCRWTG